MDHLQCPHDAVSAGEAGDVADAPGGGIPAQDEGEAQGLRNGVLCLWGGHVHNEGAKYVGLSA